MSQFLNSYQEFETKKNAFVLRVERDRTVAPKKFDNSKYLNFYVRIFIEIESTFSGENVYQLNDISLVKYDLDPSYREPVRTSSDRKNNFELKVWTYGFYPLKATIYLRLGTSLVINGNVQFPVSEDEKAINRGELN